MRKDDKRTSTQTGLTIFIAIAVFVSCAFASALFSTNYRNTIDAVLAYWHSYQHSAEVKPTPPKTTSKTKRVNKPLVLTAALAKPVVTFPDANFSLASAFAATDFCALLQPALPEMRLSWEANLFFSDTSDCSGEMSVSPTTDDSAHNSLFVQIRRNIFGASTMVRLKLVYLPERTERSFKEDFERAADSALGHILQGEAADVMSNIRKLQSFSLQVRDIDIKLFEEKLMPGAFNLTIEARCGKFRCATTSPFYKLNLPAQEKPAPEIEPMPQQE